LGAYPPPMNWHSSADEAAYLFENSGARAVVIHADLIPGVRKALPQGIPVLVVPTPAEIAEAYGIAPAPTPTGMLDWTTWLEGFAPYDGPAIPAPGTIIYTSGTTGHPKGVRRAAPEPDQLVIRNAIMGGAFGLAGHGEPHEIVSVMTGPMYHSAPNGYGAMAARIGANLILQPRFDPEELLQLIQEHRVTHLHMAPIMFHRLLKLPDEVKLRYDVSSLRFVVHAAAPCPPPIKRAMIEWWWPVIWEYYGSTETGVVVNCNTEEWLAHPGTVGKALPDCDVRVIDENGRDLPRGEIGEVVAKALGIADFTYHGDHQKRLDSEKAGLIAPATSATSTRTASSTSATGPRT
jgi:long-chain acyl-CoA synthetase